MLFLLLCWQPLLFTWEYGIAALNLTVIIIFWQSIHLSRNQCDVWPYCIINCPSCIIIVSLSFVATVTWFLTFLELYSCTLKCNSFFCTKFVFLTGYLTNHKGFIESYKRPRKKSELPMIYDEQPCHLCPHFCL